MNITDFALSMGITVTHVDIETGTTTTREPMPKEIILPDEVDCTHPMDRWIHSTFEKDNGGLGDSYDCGLCGALMQVG